VTVQESRGETIAQMRDAKVAKRELIASGPKKFVHEELVMPDGERVDWYYLDTPGSVMVVPVRSDGHVVLVRQYRHNLKRYTLELPAGSIGTGESPEEAALRELREETGYVPDLRSRLTPLGDYYVLPSETNRVVHVFLAHPVSQKHEPAGDSEIEKYFDISVTSLPMRDALARIGREIHGLETAGALMLATRGLDA